MNPRGNYEKALTKIEELIANDTLLPNEKLEIIHDTIVLFRQKQLLEGKPRIIDIVAEAYHLVPETLRGLTRKKEIIEARQFAMWCYFYYSSKSLASIGLEFFNGKHAFNHATVLYTVKKVNNVASVDKYYKAMLIDIENRVALYYDKRDREITTYKKKKNARTKLSNNKNSVNVHSGSGGNKELQACDTFAAY